MIPSAVYTYRSLCSHASGRPERLYKIILVSWCKSALGNFLGVISGYLGLLATLSNWREHPKACRTNSCRETSRGPVVTAQGKVTDDMDSSALQRGWVIRSEASKVLKRIMRNVHRLSGSGWDLSCLRYSRAFRETGRISTLHIFNCCLGSKNYQWSGPWGRAGQ